MNNVFRIVAISTLFLLASTASVFASSFPDVSKDSRFYDEIMYLSNDEIITGFPSGEFRPGEKVTRAAAAIMIGRALGYDKEQRETSFPDVPKASAASGYIQQAYENNIISGFPNGEFRPDQNVTRGEMAIFIARAYSLSEEEVVPFSDVSVNMSSFSSIRKAIAFGVTGGYENGTFRPDQAVTREQFSAFLARAESAQFKLAVNKCGYDPLTLVNPDYQTMNCLLTKAAQESEFPIPPEIVKAVASVENNGWKHFNANGEPVISDDGGIGLMQITNTTGYDVERLKYDLYYNIEVGIEFLVKNFKRTDLPRINDHDPTKLESWYFAVMAYNGIVPANSPFYQETGERNRNAYQEKVYREINNLGQLATYTDAVPMTSADFQYDKNSSAPIVFLKKSYEMNADLLKSTKQLFKSGDVVKYEGSGLRSVPSTQGTLTATTASDSITIIGAPVYDHQATSRNQFAWYPVQVTKNGKTTKGFIASQYVVQ
jgi:hypothetical protein